MGLNSIVSTFSFFLHSFVILQRLAASGLPPWLRVPSINLWGIMSYDVESK
jgi:hypothetical protein